MARVRGASKSRELREKQGGGKYLSLDDGDEFEIAFSGVLKHGLDDSDKAEPLGLEVVWVQGKNGRYSVEYDPNQHDEDDAKATFYWNVVVRNEDDSLEPKILQQGPGVFDKFIKHKDKKGYKFWFTVSRTGKGQFDTRYDLEREDRLTDEELEAVLACEEFDLDKEGKGPQEDEEPKEKRRKPRRSRTEDAPRTRSRDESSSNGSSGSNGKAAAGLSDEQMSQLKGAFAEVPDPVAAQTEFKAKFGCTRVRDLDPDLFDAAYSFIANHGKEPPKTEVVEEDPFLS